MKDDLRSSLIGLCAISLWANLQFIMHNKEHDCRKDPTLQAEMNLKDSLYRQYSGIILSDTLHKWCIRVR